MIDARGPSRRLLWIALGLAILVLLLDQASKWYIVTQVMQPPRSIEVTGFFNLVLVHNKGVSFGFAASDGPWQRWLLSGLAIAIIVGLVVWQRHQTRLPPWLALGLIGGGAIGNVIDRMHAPGVIDFLDFHGWLFNYPPLYGHWPAFNVADSAITLGALLLALDGLFLDQQQST